jgi:hypothetical protein
MKGMRFDELKNCFDSMSPNAGQRMKMLAAIRGERTDGTENMNGGIINMKHKTKRLTIIAAVVAAALLTGTAIAAGGPQSIFSAMSEYLKGEEARGGTHYGQTISEYDEMDALSNKDEQISAIPAMTGSTLGSFTLSQSFYDGQSLALGYNFDVLTKPAEFGFGIGHEKFGELVNIEDKVNHTVLMLNIEEHLTEAEYERFTRELNENGSAGVIFYDLYFGDHITLADGTDITSPSAENNGVVYTTTELDNGVLLEFSSPLNAAARDKDELNILMTLKCSTWYYYQDSTGAYWHFEPNESSQIALSIPRSK